MVKRSLILLLLFLSLADYVARGYRSVSTVSISDFQDPYVGAQLWSRGLNPYDRAIVRTIWKEDTGLEPINEIKTIYPISAYVLLVPFTWFEYRTALALWLALQLASVFAIAFLIWTKKWLGASALSTFTLVSAYSPFHTALHGANCGPLCMSLGLAACLLENPTLAGILLAISICLKPQIAIWFLFYFLVTRNWVAFTTSIFAGVLIAGISVTPFLTRIPELVTAYRVQYSHGFDEGTSGDYTKDKSDRLSMVNLQPAIYQVSKSKAVANGTALIVFCLLAGWWFYAARNSSDKLLILSALIVLSILPIYRRTNDIGLFVLPLAWGLQNLRSWPGKVVAVCAALFFIPINSILARLDIYGFVSGIQSWLVLTMATVLIYALWNFSNSKRSILTAHNRLATTKLASTLQQRL